MKIKKEFDEWAHEKGMCLDITWGEHEDPYINPDTRLAFEIWMESAKRMDKITRHACAENVIKLDDVEMDRFPTPLRLDGCISRDKAHSTIINTNAFKEE